MKIASLLYSLIVVGIAGVTVAHAQTPRPVTVDNFVRAESACTSAAP